MLTRLLHRPLLASLALAAAGLLIFLPALGDGIVARNQELRVILTARDMARGGDWIVPHFMGEERLRKPPLMYWLAATSMKVLNDTTTAAAPRLPAALAGSLLLVVTWLGGRALVGRRAAWLGALALATTAGILRHARLAETDIVQTLSATAATVCAFRALGAPGAWRWWIVAGLAAGIGAMTKGPGPVAIPVAAIAAYALLDRKRVRPFRVALGLLGVIAIAAALTLPWYAAVAARTAATGAQVSSEAALLLSESRHARPFYYYLHTLPGRMGLWAVPFLAALPLLHRHRKHRGVMMLTAWLGSAFVVLSSISSKQPHYALLLLPPSALVAGLALDRAVRGVRTRSAQVVRVALISACTGVALLPLAGIIAAASGLERGLLTGLWPWLTAAALVCLAALVCPKRSMATTLAASIAMALGTIAYAVTLDDRIDEDAVIRQILVRNAEAIRTAPVFASAGPHTAMAWFYGGRAAAKASDWTAAPSGSVLFVSARKDSPLEGIPQAPAVDQAYSNRTRAALFVRSGAGAP